MSNNTQGILWALLSTALFAMVAAMAKVAVVEYHVLQILFFRQVVVFLSTLPSIKRSFPHSLKTNYPKIHMARLIGAFVALSCSIWAVEVLPLTTAITLGFAEVFFATILAFVFLNERVNIHRIVAVILGFIGVIFVMRPGLDGLFNIYALIPIASAMGASVTFISVRKLSQTESTATLLAYQSIFVGLFAAIPLFWLWKTPSLQDLVFLIVMGVLATIANWIAVKALRLAQASVIGSIKYTQLFYAAIIGVVIFDEIPDSYTIVGATIIIGSALYLLHQERLKKRAVQNSSA